MHIGQKRRHTPAAGRLRRRDRGNAAMLDMQVISARTACDGNAL
jgi:hypothetical protein